MSCLYSHRAEPGAWWPCVVETGERNADGWRVVRIEYHEFRPPLSEAIEQATATIAEAVAAKQDRRWLGST